MLEGIRRRIAGPSGRRPPARRRAVAAPTNVTRTDRASRFGMPKLSDKELEILCAVAKVALPVMAIAGIAGAIIAGANPSMIILTCISAGFCVDLSLMAAWKHKQIVAKKMNTAGRTVQHAGNTGKSWFGISRDWFNGTHTSQGRAIEEAIENTFFLKYMKYAVDHVVNWASRSAADLQEAVDK